ncbi:TetR/AcrR family transcriptional regulator [Specibacter sp. RAF43]|uniref:TetR/AcrR family transcriptional regulator n=1 Tax=Specibacter sp. RAF43 TaxID=3233057 RepID=UPI003F971E1A
MVMDKAGNEVGTMAHWKEYGDSLVPPILQTALTCFVENGYHGTTTRQLAAAAGLSVPGLYHHFASKQAMLVSLMEIAMADLYRRSMAALEEAGESVEARFRSIIECFVLFHAYRGELAFISASEIRALEPEARARHIASRDRQQRVLEEIVEEGVRVGYFRTESPRDASRAVITMCTGVSQWYRPGGQLSPAVLAEEYVLLTQRALGREGSQSA